MYSKPIKSFVPLFDTNQIILNYEKNNTTFCSYFNFKFFISQKQGRFFIWT